MIEYREAGVDVALRRAADILTKRGLANGITHDIDTDSIDVVGAVIVALGGRCNSPMYADLRIPPARVPAFEATVELLEAEFGDIYEWSDSTPQAEVVRGLVRVSDLLSVAVI